jgi:protein-tyrosine phosphatase
VTHIALQGALNLRDLGGLPTGSGQKVSPGRVFRGDALARLTDADLAVLAAIGQDGAGQRRTGLRTVIDFRSDTEVASAGPDRLPPGTGTVALPVNAGNLDAFFTAGPAGLPALLGGGKGEEFMTGINRQFVADPALRAQFASALHLIADAGRQPVLYHCTAGKDRTGWMTAVLLTALGVSRDTVVADYLATNDYVWPAYERQLAATPDLLELVRPVLVQSPAYLAAAFDEVDARYGTFGAFLADGLGFTAADLARLRATMLS